MQEVWASILLLRYEKLTQNLSLMEVSKVLWSNLPIRGSILGAGQSSHRFALIFVFPVRLKGLTKDSDLPPDFYHLVFLVSSMDHQVRDRYLMAFSSAASFVSNERLRKVIRDTLTFWLISRSSSPPLY